MSTLTIYSVSSNDYGSYACEAKNSLGPGQIAKAVLSGKRNFRVQYFNENLFFFNLFLFRNEK